MQTKTTTSPKAAAVLGLITGAFFSIGSVQALTINLTDIGAGDHFGLSGLTAMGAPTLGGTGSLSSVMDAAASYWEGVFLDAATVNIDFGWDDLGGATLASAGQYAVARDYSGTGKMGEIRFDSDGPNGFYADDDVLSGGEFGALVETDADLGATSGLVNVERTKVRLPGEDAAGLFDLFTTAIHEIGHLLGMSNLGQPGDADFFDGSATLTTGPFMGATFATSSGHLEVVGALMHPTANGDRVFASDLDIAAIAALNGWTNVNYDAARLVQSPAVAVAAVPLPASGLLMLVGIGALGAGLRRKIA